MYGCENEIIREAIERYPEEMVGYVKDNEFVPLKNISKSPEKRYQLSIKDKIFILDHSIDYLVHSHPYLDSYPSELDLKSQKSTGIPFLIIGTNGKAVTKIQEVS